MTHLPISSEPPVSPNSRLTMYDLPSENPEDPGSEEFDCLQGWLLLIRFLPPNWNPKMVFCAIRLYLYYDVNHPLWYKQPDWFGVVGVPRLYEGHDLRLSYVVWQEQVSPFIVVEFSSPATADEDLGKTVNELGKPPTKWYVYEQILKVPYYVVFSHFTNEMQAFRLVENRYQPAELTQGRLAITELELSLGLWKGSYRSHNRLWLRWMTLEGEVIPIAEEETEAWQEVAASRDRADASRDRAQRLAARLREMGIDPDELD